MIASQTRFFLVALATAWLALLSVTPAPAQPLGDQLGAFGDEEWTPEVVVGLESQRDRVTPGDQLALAVVIDHQDGWHVNLNQPVVPAAMGNFAPIPTTIEVFDTGGLTIGPAQWPEPYVATVYFTGEPVEFPVYAGKAVAYVPIQIDPAVPVGTTLDLAVVVSYQACDDSTCLAPETVELSLSLEVVSLGDAAAASTATNAELFASFDASTFANPDAWDDLVAQSTPSASGSSFFGITLPRADSPVGFIVVSLLAVVGGLVLNLTPCVLPVIPIKVLTLSQHAGSPGKSLVLGLWMAAGVVGFWLALGVLAATFTGLADPSRLFGYWWFTGGIGVLIAAMGVGIMGAFNINLPQSVYMINPKADNAGGSFLFGVMTAVLGLPCFGFVAGALLAGAATMPTLVILTIFGALGVGMALPYLVLAVRPGLVEKLPRTGPASEVVKQVMGLLLLAAAAFFIGAGVRALAGSFPSFEASLPWWAKSLHWWFVALFASAAGVWLLVRTIQITKRAPNRLGFAAVALILAAGGVAAAVDQSLKARNDIWLPYTETLLAERIEAGEVVVLDFTADWCLNCKVLESTVLLSDSVRPRLTGDGVIPIKADLTSNSAPGWQKLSELGQTGIPLLVIYGPGLETPWLSNAYTTDQVLEALEQAAAPAPIASR